MMLSSILFLLVLFQLKHWYLDFAAQTKEEIQYKGIYSDWRGITHSVKHGLGTFLCLWVVTGWYDVELALLVGIIDMVLHYHIDWYKMNFGCKDIADPKFWNHLGLDQMAHQLCYISYIGIFIV
jgi:hypothetical protein